MCNKKVPVFFILVGIQFKDVFLGTTFNSNGFTFAFLLRKYTGNHRFSKLQFGFNPEKTLTSGDQRTVQREGNISCFKQLENFIFFSFVFEFEFVLKFKGGFCIIVGFKFNFITDFGNNTHLNFFLEIEIGLSPLADIHTWVIPTIG